MGEDEEATGKPGNFHSKSVWARIMVIAGGPIFNFILAFVMAIVLVAMSGFDAPVISAAEDGYPAAKAGLQAGDEIIKIGNDRIHFFREISFYNQTHQGEEVRIIYKRDGVTYSATLKPQMDEEAGYYRLGIISSGVTKANFGQSIVYGWHEVGYTIKTTITSLRMLITGKFGLSELTGPVGIVQMANQTYEASKDYAEQTWEENEDEGQEGAETSGSWAMRLFVAKTVFIEFLYLAVLLSANLGVMNLLPIPALDGGRLVFLLVEAVTRKKIPPEKEGIVHLIGFVLLIGLMVVVMFQDIRKLFV
jgi:regulator of sigma E protease